MLSDAKKRKEYDEARSLFGGGGFRFPRGGAGGGQAGPSVDDLFRNAGDSGLGDLFGGLFNQGQTRTQRYSTSRGPRRGAMSRAR